MATDKKVGDNLISTFKKSISDLEEFQVQFALGKAEAKEKYEEVKKKFNNFLHTTKANIALGKERKEKLQNDFEYLQVQLALGKAETLEVFNEQKKKIFSAINKLEKSIENKSKVFVGDLDEKIRHEVEKFRIKMELLRVQYELGKLNVTDQFEERKHELSESVAKLKAKFEGRKKVVAKTRQLRHQEMREAYKHMKKAFVLG
ncbi:MAG: hypothetical protein NT084_03285 [Bacteroidetes bacterium]|nr:hypothetical protein [Bacteroidota bacterium]